jgi:hypothetical protein
MMIGEPMSYARSQPARSPDGAYYEVAASPRGDLLLYQSETGIGSWFSASVGLLGLAGYLVNLVVFRRRWRVVVRTTMTSRAASPTSGVVFRRDVAKKSVDEMMLEFVTAIESGSIPAR